MPRFDFDKVADRYDKWYGSPVSRMTDNLEKEAVLRFLPRSFTDGNLLDVGCGTGHWSELFCEMGYKVTGIDPSLRMLEYANARKLDNASFIEGVGESLPFEDGSFDIVSNITALEFADDPQATVQEMFRCVKPGGRLLFGVLNRWSYHGIKRKLRGDALFASANLFSQSSLKRLLLESGGRVHVESSSFFFPWESLVPYAHSIEKLGRRLKSPLGTLLVGVVDK